MLMLGTFQVSYGLSVTARKISYIIILHVYYRAKLYMYVSTKIDKFSQPLGALFLKKFMSHAGKTNV